MFVSFKMVILSMITLLKILMTPNIRVILSMVPLTRGHAVKIKLNYHGENKIKSLRTVSAKAE